MSRDPLKIIGGLGACLRASEKEKIRCPTNVSDKTNLLKISVKTRHQRAIGLAEWLKVFVQGFKLLKKKMEHNKIIS